MKDQDSRQRTKTRRTPGNSPASGRPGPSLNMDELRELIALLRENDLCEFELEREGFRVRLRRGVDFTGMPNAEHILSSVPHPLASAAATEHQAATLPVLPAAATAAAIPEDQDLHIISSPIVGTFYRARSPNAEPFVKAGSHVDPGTIVCIIEAMKLMNEIQAEAAGEVVKIYVENGQPVEYGQPLFGIRS